MLLAQASFPARMDDRKISGLSALASLTSFDMNIDDDGGLPPGEEIPKTAVRDSFLKLFPSFEHDLSKSLAADGCMCLDLFVVA